MRFQSLRLTPSRCSTPHAPSAFFRGDAPKLKPIECMVTGLATCRCGEFAPQPRRMTLSNVVPTSATQMKAAPVAGHVLRVPRGKSALPTTSLGHTPVHANKQTPFDRNRATCERPLEMDRYSPAFELLCDMPCSLNA